MQVHLLLKGADGSLTFVVGVSETRALEPPGHQDIGFELELKRGSPTKWASPS
jgi:hypothetical protein